MSQPGTQGLPARELAENKNQPSVLVLSGVRGDTRRYRSIHPYEQLKLSGVACQLAHITDPKLPNKITRASVIIFHRTSFNAYVQHLFEAIQERDGLIISDVDDLVFDPTAFHWINSPDFQDPVRAKLYQEEMRRNRATLEASQAVTTSTQYLVEQVRALDKPSWVHRNAFSLEMLAYSEAAFQKRQHDAKKVVIGYASGTPTHDRDFEVAKPALQSVLRKFPHAEVWIIGQLDPGNDWGGLNDRVRHYKLVPWRDLPDKLAAFDINIAPLVMNNPFGKSKSEIKYVEAGLVRVPTIASPTEAFKFAIQSGVNGILAGDDNDWSDALTMLVEETDVRQTMGESAYTDILERYHPLRRTEELIDTLDQIHEQIYEEHLWIAYKPRPTQAHFPSDNRLAEPTWDSAAVERTPTLAQMALYTLQHRGLRTMLMQVWIFLRRLVAPIIPYKKTAS
jgi:glycosyltransferase involved in cell wall biosynthesis